MLTTLADFVQRAADALFVPWLLLLLFGTGIFLTIRYRFVQVRAVRRPPSARCCPARRAERPACLRRFRRS